MIVFTLLWLSVFAGGYCDPTGPPLQLIGGKDVYDFDQYTYMAQIFFHDTVEARDPFRAVCSGIVVSKLYVLTAAHCYQPCNVSPAKYSTIVLGTKMKMFDFNVTHIRRSGSKVFVHPGYVSYTLANDLALVKMSEPVPLTNLGPTPINVVPMATEYEHPDGDTCMTVGWGGDGVQASTLLQQLHLPMLEKKICKQQYTSYNASQSICAGQLENNNFGLCKDDSGSPLMCLVSGSHPWKLHKLFGVFSHRANCIIYLWKPELRPSYFTSIPHYREWIDSMVTEDMENQNKTEHLLSS